MAEVTYTRCKDCGYVYEDNLAECPVCGSPTVISEEAINEAVFNIMD